MLIFSFICSILFLLVFVSFVVMMVVSFYISKKNRSKLTNELDYLLSSFNGGVNDKEKK